MLAASLIGVSSRSAMLRALMGAERLERPNLPVKPASHLKRPAHILQSCSNVSWYACASRTTTNSSRCQEIMSYKPSRC